MSVVKKFGFTLKTIQVISELKATASLWCHEKTGAQLLSLQNDDNNKSFAISFPTLPTDNTGVAHILEHSVLNGSRKFPVKEPFVELMKSSVCSFLNAFTYPDKTVYPLASQNEEDFYNLIDVYLDAVFFPNLTEQTFQQEGWHYEPSETGWEYKGVVFNEMKGAGLSPDRHVWQVAQEALFPHTPYSWDSGGVPEKIVTLTYQQFCQFHLDNYHPSRALIWMSGNDPEDRRLAALAAYLDEFAETPARKPPSIPVVPRRKKILRKFGVYPATSADSKQVFATRTWVLTDALAVKTQIELSLLEYLLIGTSTAPLRKALIDSGLGDDLAGGGIEFDLRQKTFSVGLRGLHEANAEQVFSIISKTLQHLAAEGFSNDAIQAALTTIEFSLRENNSGSFPQGLSLGLRVLRGWLYGADPISLLPFEQPLQAVKDQIVNEPAYLQKLLVELFLHNNHSVELVLVPDPELITQQARAEQLQLKQFAAALSKDEENALRQTAEKLQADQRTPDTTEALKTLPRLRLTDLPKKSQVVPSDAVRLQSSMGYLHELQTNGIVYIDLAWPIRHLSTEQLPLVGIFASALTELGTATYPEDQLQTVIDSRTGGLSTQVFIGQQVGSESPAEYVMIRLKALPDQLPAVFTLVHSLITETAWENAQRFIQLLAEERAQFEANMSDEGHRLVASRLASHLTAAGAVAEQLTGVSQLHFLRGLSQRAEQQWPVVQQSLSDLAHSIFSQPVLWNATADPALRPLVLEQLESFARRLHFAVKQPACEVERSRLPEPGVEALTFASPVNFAGLAMRLPMSNATLSGSVLVAAQLLRTDYLWNTVRVQGGAYGASVRIEPISGVVVATSYRDPQVTATIEAFTKMENYLQTAPIADTELEKAKISTLGDIDQYRLPDAQGFLAFVQQVTGLTTPIRQELRNAVFATTRQDLRMLGAALAAVTKQYVVAMTSTDKAAELGQHVVRTPLTAL